MSQLLLPPSLLVVYILTLGRLAAGRSQHVLNSCIHCCTGDSFSNLWPASTGRNLPCSWGCEAPSCQTDISEALRRSMSANCEYCQGLGQHRHDTPSVCALQDSSRHPFEREMMHSTGVRACIARHKTAACLLCNTAATCGRAEQLFLPHKSSHKACAWHPRLGSTAECT